MKGLTLFAAASLQPFISIVLHIPGPASHALLHAFHIQHAQRKAFSDQFNRNVFVVFFKVWNFVGIDELKGIEVLFCLFRLIR